MRGSGARVGDGGWRGGMLLVLVVALVVGVCEWVGVFAHAERWTEGWRVGRMHEAVRGEAARVTVVVVDDAALRAWGAWGAGGGDWDRGRMAGVVDVLAECGAGVIGLDFLFSPATTRESDGALIAAMRRHGRVVVAGAGASGAGGVDGSAGPIRAIGEAAAGVGAVRFDGAEASPVLVRLDRFDAAGREQLGVVAARLQGGDGVVAGLGEGAFVVPWPVTRNGGETGGVVGEAVSGGRVAVVGIGPIVGVVEGRRGLVGAAEVLLGRELDGGWAGLDDATVALVDDEASFVAEQLSLLSDAELEGDRAAGLLFEALAVWSGREAFLAEERDVVARLSWVIRGGAVFVGWGATGAVADRVSTPMGAETPGVVVHAGVARGLLEGRRVGDVAGWARGVLAFVLGVFCGLAGLALRPVWAWANAAGALALWGSLAWGVVGAERGLLLPMVGVGVAGVASAVCGGVVRAGRVWRQRDAARRELAGRVSPELARALIGRDGTLALPTERRAVSVVFFDIAGFSELTERVGDEAALALLNGAMGVMAGAVRAHGGFVNKFLGDGLMALFGAPVEMEGHARAALLAVRDAQRGLRALDAGLVVRAGVSSGEALVGDCGAPPELRDYTAVGRVVNEAAHLEEAAKGLGVRVLCSRGAWEGAGEVEGVSGDVVGGGRVVVEVVGD